MKNHLEFVVLDNRSMYLYLNKLVRIGILAIHSIVALFLTLLLSITILGKTYILYSLISDAPFHLQLLATLPSLFFYSSLILWICLQFNFKQPQQLKKNILIVIFLIPIFIFEFIGIASLKFTVTGTDLFNLFYLLSQFNIWQTKFSTLALVFYGYLITGFCLFNIHFYLENKSANAITYLALSTLLFLFSLLSWQTNTAKDISFSSISYAFTSWNKIPQSQNFSNSNNAHPVNHFALPQHQRPNIVIVVLESTRKDALSYYNPELKVKTPFWTELANKGIAFEQMYSIQL